MASAAVHVPEVTPRMSPLHTPAPFSPLPYVQGELDASDDARTFARPPGRDRAWLVFLPLLLASTGCGVIIEIPLGTTSDRDDDETSTSSPADTTVDPEDGSSTACDRDECPAGTGSPSGEDTTTATPSPDPSYCQMPYAPTEAGVVTDTLTIPLMGALADVHVLVRVTHPRVGDLQISVEHDGTTLTLMDQPQSGGCEGSHVDAIFDDDAIFLADQSCLEEGSAVAGVVIPTEALAFLAGQEAGGDWTLHVQSLADPAVAEPAMLESWCVALSTDEPLD
ncbi:MAG: hypothetical protein AAGF11_32775 [Myxococcota bacterium]